MSTTTLTTLLIYQECTKGTYGTNCASTCPNCMDTNCHHVSGVCIDGCKPGYLDVMCDKVCSKGRYGHNCAETCDNCKDTDCHHESGVCRNGCKPGYKGDMCDTECAKGTYGTNCASTCPNCMGANCHHVSGVCKNGCKPGYLEVMCDKECIKGTYGTNCSSICPNCMDTNCHHVSGVCKDGCKPGYLEDMCDEVCGNGTYGNNCSKTCDNCKNTDCHHASGVCKTGCKPGYEGDMCVTECDSGKYGDDCAKTCENCMSKTCDHVSGVCEGGCNPGYTTDMCNKECQNGTYGTACNATCGSCNNLPCHHANGHCQGGCRSGFVGETCAEREGVTDENNNTVAIVGAVVGVLLAVIVVVLVLLFLFFRRRRSNKRKESSTTEVFYANSTDLEKKKTSGRNSSATKASKRHKSQRVEVENDVPVYEAVSDDLESQPSASTPQGGEQYYNSDSLARSKTAVPVDDLWNYVSKMNNDAFESEFEKFPTGMVKPYESAKANMVKNRYRGIYAYDHTRVKLSPPNDDACDYMNANYIEGYKRSRGFIASQGTTKQNIDDFWLMIWQQKCSAIVMLTNLIEEAKEKCLCYWPEEGEKKSFGALEVTLHKEEVFCNFTIRRLRVSKEEESRAVTQFHFTAWPDKGVPAYPSSLVQFHSKVRSCVKDRNHPMVVHCSAGIGRTGTFIALDYLVDQAKGEGVVDVFVCVQKLRDQRASMIQTLDQYIFLHTGLVEALHCKGHSMPSDEFRKLYEDISRKGGARVLEDDFAKLENVYSAQTVVFKAGKEPGNVVKNRDQSILPADNERPILNTNIPGCDNYINAVYLPGLRKRRQFIVTQTPLENTVIDFWRMVYEQSTKVIVDLSADPESFQVYPDNSDLTIGPIKVTSLSKEHDEEINTNVQSLTVTYDEVHAVKLFRPLFWDLRHNTPESVPIMMRLIYEVNRCGQYGHNGGIVVTCPDGATRCGLFCAAFVSLDRLRVEQEVGTGQIIKQYRSIRPQIIPNKEQLKYCYDMLMFHLNENETYSNFA